jgi:hypothetical protein
MSFNIDEILSSHPSIKITVYGLICLMKRSINKTHTHTAKTFKTCLAEQRELDAVNFVDIKLTNGYEQEINLFSFKLNTFGLCKTDNLNSRTLTL